MRIFLSPLNPTVGDLAGNAALIKRSIEAARQAAAHLAVLPELCLCGYPPRDLLQHRSFIAACERTAHDLAREVPDSLTLVFGVPLPCDDRPAGITNSLVACRGGKIIARYDKRLLPTYDVFDEDRYFVAGTKPCVIDVKRHKVGLAICEDLWKGVDADVDERYAKDGDPIAELSRAGAETIVVASASPFVAGKRARHHDIVMRHSASSAAAVVTVDQFGGNDELIFDGAVSFARPGEVAQMINEPFSGRPALYDTSVPPPAYGELSANAELVRAISLGLRDYVHKTGFESAIIGLSGGIDSALTAALAVHALGADQVMGVSMPGRYSSEGSVTDARDLADRLGIPMVTCPIEGAFEGFAGSLNPAFRELGAPALGAISPDLANENLQSRVRGTLMMTLSNRLGSLVLTTGNKSEIAVGYSTLYGDMNGALAVISDLPKMQVYALSEHLNRMHEAYGFSVPPIPENTILKPPSAELAPDQFDSDSLPDYEVLDEIVCRYVERREPVELIIMRTQFDANLVRRIVRLIDRNEYKRKQLTTGLKVSPVAFGVGRRMPIAQGWREG